MQSIKLIVEEPPDPAAGLIGWTDEITITFKYREDPFDNEEIDFLRSMIAEFTDAKVMLESEYDKGN